MNRISGDLIFAFIAITFTTQNLTYAEIIPGNVSTRNFSNRKKWLTQIKRLHIFPFRKFCDTQKKKTPDIWTVSANDILIY